MDEPKVAIVLVCYNGFNDTIECLQSLRQIKYNNFEVIIVDNGSRKECVDRLKESLQRGEILIQAVNNGFSAGNNIGITEAIKRDCKYILLLNNDTVAEEDFLNQLVNTAITEQNQAAVAPKIRYFFDKSQIWYAGGDFNYLTGRTTHIGIGQTDCGKYNTSRNVEFVSGCCILLPVEMINAVGFMDEDYFLYCEDLDYCRKIRNAGYRLVYEPGAIIYHKVSASTGKQSNLVTYYMVRNKLYIIRKYIKFPRRVIATVYNALETTKRIMTREYNSYPVICALIDYKRGIVGKTNRSL